MSVSKINMVEIPDRDAFLEFAQKNSTKGYAALGPAWQSYQLKRSTNSATILLLGLTGAGKSHLINNLFASEITPVGEGVSCTKEIVEFTIAMPSENVGILNSKIHVIDCPGFGDTEGGIAYDACVMANINNLFQERKYRPNFIIMAVNITDKRLEGQFAPFVKLLKCVKKQLLGTVLDTKNPNLIVVLTHLCSALPKLQRDPSCKKEIIKRLVRENIGFHNIHVEVAENMMNEYELEKCGEYYVLPNQEYFPRNIYLSMVALAKGMDPVGHGIVNEAYLKLTSGKYPVISTKHAIKEMPSVNKVVEDIMRMQISETTEVGDNLSRGWNELTPEQQSNSRMTPTELAQKLSILGYKCLSDLPKTKTDAVKFFREVVPDKSMEILLKKSLGLEAPSVNFDLLVGKAFDLTKDRTTNFNVLDAGTVELSPVGCRLPKFIEAIDCNEVKFICNVTNSTREMTEQRLKELKINVDIGNFEFNYEQRDGYNVFSQGKSSTMTAIYAKHSVKLELRQNTTISNELKSAVENLPTQYDKHNPENVQMWRNFFSTYGTHYINTAYIGGSVVFKLSNNSQSSGKSSFDVSSGGIGGFLGSIFGSVSYNDSNSSLSSSSFNKKDLQIIVSGGDSSKASNLALSSTKEQFLERLRVWEATIWEHPVVTDQNVALGDIADVVNRFHSSVVNAMKNAASDLYHARLEYEERKLSPPTKQEDNNANRNRLEYEERKISPPTKQEDSNANRNSGSECLTAHTLISTPSGEHAIATLKQGDLVLNKNGKPVRVVGVNKVFTSRKTNLYGFKTNDSPSAIEPFFTNGHTFLHPSGDILVQNKFMLEQTHPQMRTEFTVREMPHENIEILSLDGEKLKTTIVPELTSADVKEDQELYFLVVEGDGTYIANGFVCYHELPKFEAWPFTFTTIFESVKFLKPLKNVFAVEDFNNVMKLSIDIKAKWEMMYNNPGMVDHVDHLPQDLKYFDNALSHLPEIINNTQQANLGMMLYSSCGELLHQCVDIGGMPIRAFVIQAQEVLAAGSLK